MAEPCCTDPRTGLPRHDRLDLKQHSLEFRSIECGTINRLTNKPDYCCFECPLLIANIKLAVYKELNDSRA